MVVKPKQLFIVLLICMIVMVNIDASSYCRATDGCKLVIYEFDYFDFDHTITVANFNTFDLIILMRGTPRIVALRTHFERLQTIGAHLAIASRQSKSNIIQILQIVDLFKFFDIDSIRGGNGETATWSDKFVFVERLIKQFGCVGCANQVVLVDQDNSFLRDFNRERIRTTTCNGLTQAHMTQIETHFTSLPTTPYPYQ